MSARRPLLALAAEAGTKATQARDILDQVCEATARVRHHLDEWRCHNPVSKAAANAVEQATARLQ
ncbi:MAG TPA: hypothetical protein PKW90_17635, partial [Myxococcota bacterium]|nr:hypothetical protein [Myxococcota bacterium]